VSFGPKDLGGSHACRHQILRPRGVDDAGSE